MRAPVKIGMILMPHNRSDGKIDRDRHRFLGDSRMPSRITYGAGFEQSDPAVIGFYVRRPGCEDGRHLFDVIESSHYVEGESDEFGEKTVVPDVIHFNAQLTCVRCGYIEAWEGTRKGKTPTPHAIDPTPIRVGALFAQEIDASQGYGRDTSTWAVHDVTGEAVGVIAWASGKRGRAFFHGRLFGWPEGDVVEGKTPIAVLRKISTAAAATEPVAIQAGA